VSATVAPIGTRAAATAGSKPSCAKRSWQDLSSEDSSDVAARSDSLAAGLATVSLRVSLLWLVE